MKKFDSKEFERKQIEKLKQEQLIKSIENRKQIELQALIEATKKCKGKSQEDIIKVKNQIIQKELNKENEKNEKEVRRKIEHIRDVEKQVRQMDRGKILEEHKIKDKSEKIVKGIIKKVYEQNDDTNLLEKQEAETNKAELMNFFRNNISPERAKMQEQKSYDILEQWKKELQIASSSEDEIFKQLEEEFRTEEENRKNANTVKSIVEMKRKKLSTKEPEDKNEKLKQRWKSIKDKQEQEEKIKIGQEILDEARGTKLKRQFKKFVEKINPFKTKRGVQAYQKNIEEYNMEFGNNSRSSKVDIKIQSAQEKKLTPSQYLFGQYYQKAYINHQKAQKDAQDNANVEPIFEPKIP